MNIFRNSNGTLRIPMWHVAEERPLTQEEKNCISAIIVVLGEFGKSARIYTIDGLFFDIVIDPALDLKVGTMMDKNMVSVITSQYGRKNLMGEIIPIDDRGYLYRMGVL